MAVNRLLESDSVVSSLRTSLTSGASGLDNVPRLIKRAIREDCWRAHEIELTGEIATFDRFEDFVTTPPLEGLGASIETLKRLCTDDTEAADMIDEAIRNRPGNPHLTLDNVQGYVAAPTGNTASQALRRLRDQRQDLHARVIAGELSPHRAMVEAGFRPKTITVPVDPDRAARTLFRGFGEEQSRVLMAALARLLDSD